MSAATREKARKTGDFRCQECHEKTHAKAGDRIPKCPHCGNGSFDTRGHEPGNNT